MYSVEYLQFRIIKRKEENGRELRWERWVGRKDVVDWVTRKDLNREVACRQRYSGHMGTRLHRMQQVQRPCTEHAGQVWGTAENSRDGVGVEPKGGWQVGDKTDPTGFYELQRGLGREWLTSLRI
jgi:hypothetical protein